jgi:hypothetical protein
MSRPGDPDPRGMIAASQYAQGFEGMATAPFTDEQRRVLAETPAHEDVEIKPDGICFMPGVWYRRQLTKAFGAGGWSLAPRGPVRTVGDTTTYHGALYVLGRWVSEAVGECDNQWMSPATRTESARTDCLTRCCKDLCMASELWDKAWREDWMRKNAESYDSRTKKNKDGSPKKEWRLKARREARAADLGFTDDGGAPASPSVTNVPKPADDTGEAPAEEVVQAIAGHMKRLKWKKDSCVAFLEVYFGQKTVRALSSRQAEAAESLLKAWDTDWQEKVLAELRSSGRVLA